MAAALGPREVTSSGLGIPWSCPHPEEHAGATLCQALSDQFGGPHRRLRQGMVAQADAPCKCTGQEGCGTVQRGAQPPPGSASSSMGRPVSALSGRNRRAPAMALQPGMAGTGLVPAAPHHDPYRGVLGCHHPTAMASPHHEPPEKYYGVGASACASRRRAVTRPRGRKMPRLG